MAVPSNLAILPADALNTMLAAHGQWLASSGREGQRAECYRLDLSGLDLSGADLRRASLRECRLEQTRLHGARLNYADLHDSHGLLAWQLAGADTSGARLPDDIDLLDRLAHIEALTVGGRKLLFMLLLAVGYTWLTIATTTDVDLLTHGTTTPLPIILTELQVSGFYWVAPLLLLGFYIYFQLNLQRLWEDLAALPAFFPDGRSVAERTYPWLFTSLSSAYNTWLRQSRPAMARLQNLIAIGVGWYLIPITLAALWLRYLPRHDVWGSSLHGLCFIIAIITGIVFYRLAAATLSAQRPLRIWTAPSRYPRWLLEAMLLGLGLILLPILTYGTLALPDPAQVPAPASDPRSWSPRLLQVLGYDPFANFRGQELSERPANWSPDQPMLDRVQGVNLQGADLHHANAVSAFMINADLRQAKLAFANLELADLRGAQLNSSDLRRANLLQTDLRAAVLTGADLRDAALVLAQLQNSDLRRVDLRGAFLNDAHLNGANLAHADLRDAYLVNADLRGADVTLAIFRGADLRGSDLRAIQGFTCTQFQDSTVNDETRFSGELPVRAVMIWLGLMASVLTTKAYTEQAPLDDQHITIGKAVIQVSQMAGELAIPPRTIRASIAAAARAVSAYYNGFPVNALHVTVTPRAGKRLHGVAYGGEQPLIILSMGTGFSAADLAADWVVTHEMVHLAFPPLLKRHTWIEEGLATYVEPLARAQAGLLSEQGVWRWFLNGIPKGLPGPGDRGLDHTPTWGRTYWGGAMFCLLADLQIREQTQNRFAPARCVAGHSRPGWD